MPTTQKSPQKHTKATQKVGGSAKKPVMKAMEGGSAKKPVTKAMEGGSTKKTSVTKAVGGGKSKVAAVKSKATTRGGSARGGMIGNLSVPKLYEETKERSITNSTRIDNFENTIKKTNTKISDLEKVINTKISDLETTIKFMYLNDNIWKSKEFKSELKKHLKYIRFLSDDSFILLYTWYPETNIDLNIPPEVLNDVPRYIRDFFEINGEKDKYEKPE
jgi:hypothetical protein